MQASTNAPTGKRYPIGTIAQMADVPEEEGVRARMMAELPLLIKEIERIRQGIPALAEIAHKRRPVWAFWMTKASLERHLLRQLASGLTYTDDGKGEATVALYYDGDAEEHEEPLFHKTIKLGADA